MNKLLLIILLFAFQTTLHAQINSVEPQLLSRLTDETQQEDFVVVRLLLADRVDVDSLGQAFDQQGTSFEHRVRTTTRLLIDKAAATQPAWLQFIAQLDQQMPNQLKYVNAYWISNLLVLEAKPAFVLALVQANLGIEVLEEDQEQYYAPDPVVVEQNNSPEAPNGTEVGLRVVRAPFLWQRDYTGRGRLAMNSDTGVNLVHPALSNRWRGLFVPAAHAWLGVGTSPNDCAGSTHGTHVMGTMVGLQQNTNDTIGLAFNAQWIAAGSLCGGAGTSTTGAFQWALNPDNDTSTVSDVPDVINNSWGGQQGTSQCNSTVVPIFNALEAAGVAVVFSAGNSGPGVSTITSPKNINTNEVNVFSTGNIQGAVAGFPIANSSSRGPSICINGNTELLIKPEVVAPGTNVRSASGTNGYANLTGTSMAAPHVAGAVLLLKEAFPYLSGSDILRAIYYSATDLGVPGEDNIFGNGLMNLEAAFNYLVAQNNVPARPNYGDYNVRAQALVQPATIVCSDSIQPQISFVNLGDSIVSAATIFYRIGNQPYTSMPWNGLLGSDDADTIQLPSIGLPAGLSSVSFNFKVVLDTNFAEIDTFDNQKTTIIYRRGLINGGLLQDLEANNLNGTQLIPVNPDGRTGWAINFTNGRPVGNRSVYMNNFSYGDRGERDFLETPRIVTPSAGVFQLRFALAHAVNNNSNDSLNIYASSDCGDTWVKIYGKGGTDLATTAPQTTRFTPVSANHWRRETVDLSAYLGTGDLALRFENVNDNGNSIYLDDIQVLVSAMPPVATFSFALQSGCDTVGVQLLSDVFNADSLHWTIAPGLTDTATNPLVNLAAGVYNVQLTAINSFGSASFSGTVNVPDAPVANFRLLDSVYNAGRLIGLINLSQFGQSYRWDFGDGTTATGFSPQKSYTQQGTYTIQLWTSNASCTDSLLREDVVTIIQGVSVQELASEQFKLYPNPASDHIKLSWGDVQARELLLMNATGQVVQRLSIAPGTSTLELPLGSLTHGLYFARLSGADFSSLKKFIVQ